jgi:drug/metabolite transporter (DMT)-like permease
LNRTLLGTALVAGAAAMFGTLSLITRNATETGLDVLPFTAWRAGVSTLLLVLTGVLIARGSSSLARLPDIRVLRPDRRVPLLIACLAGTFINIAMFAAFVRMSVAVTLLTFYVFPAIVTLCAVPLYGERLSGVRIFALALSMTGLGLVLVPTLAGSTGVNADLFGVGLALLAALCQATFVLITGRGFEPMPPLHVSTFVLLSAFVVSLPLALLLGEATGLAVPLAMPDAWIWIIVGATIGAAIPSVFFVAGIGMIGPSRAAILMTIEPLVGVSIAAIALGEQPSVVQLIGGACVLAAAIILQLAPRAASVPAESEYGRTV